MKKSLKIFLIALLAFSIFSVVNCVEANTIQDISMDIYIDNSGNAHITEVWNCNVTQGTEVYHPYYNLGNSEIIDFTVSENNKDYRTLSYWNTSGSLSTKANKCGINTISNGVELCWGISEYGTHTYTAKYTITNFVSELTDSQMIYWTLIPYEFSTSIGSVYIKIHTDFKIADTIDVWGYGNYGGTAYVYNGYIEMQSDGRLASNEYMTILVKFPLGTFNTINKLNNDFNYYYNMSQEGATKYTEDSGVNIFYVIYCIIIFIILLFSMCFAYSKHTKIEKQKLPKDIPYFRDIPCDGDIFKSYFIAHHYKLFKNKTDILGALILKWLKNSLIRIEQKETGTIFKKENAVVILNETNPSSLSDDREKRIFRMLLEASKDGILEGNEFEKWCSKSYDEILDWFDDIIKAEENKLISSGEITIEKKKFFKIFNRKSHVFSSKLYEDALAIAGLRRYLLEYTLIKDREAIQVHLFEDYLIFAQILGIANKVAKQFKDLYPEIINQSNYNSYDNIVFINTCASRGIRNASAAKSRAENYSSGGGGFSSGGGGGGSFGGGGGGGGFR